MKKRTVWILVIVVIAGAGAFYYFRSGKKTEQLALVTVAAQAGDIAKTATATGTVQPVDTVSVGAQVSGVVKTVYVDFNSTVRKGQLLAKIDPSIINEQAAQSRANLQNAESNLEYQQNNYQRQSQLYTLGAISKAEFQLAQNQYNAAKAAVSNSAAQLRLNEKNLSYTDIFSPINGVVLNRNVSAGQTIASSFNAPTLFVIAKDLSRMQVRAAVDEADIGNVRSGQHVNFTVDAFPDEIFRGTVEKILLHPSVSANVVTYTTLIDIDNSDMKLKPGMTASITVFVDEDSTRILVPAKALSFKPDSSLSAQYKVQHLPGKDTRTPADRPNLSYIWVKHGDTLTERTIETGFNDNSNVKVLAGLASGEEVIIGTTSGRNASISTAQNTARSPFMPRMTRRPATTKPTK
jgi:HlyD family secretion protein